MDFRAQEPVQEHVAGAEIGGIFLGHTPFQLNHGKPAELARRRRGQADEVGLDGPGDQEGIGFFRLGGAAIVFELTYLVAAHGQRQGIVTLGQKLDPQAGSQTFQPVQAAWQGRKRRTGMTRKSLDQEFG